MAVAPTTHPGTPENADPSMEEILASIRRILNEDDPAPEANEKPPEPEPPGSDDILVLDSSMMVAPPEPPAPPPQAVAEIPLMRTSPQPAPQPVRAQELPMPPPQADVTDEGLVAPAAAAAAASSLGSLMRTLTASKAPSVWAGGPTLEDMVRGELRILLKDWLDTNLPPMVERLVRAEIERVVGRAVP
jgi:cell pole-organizing protein PopZ